MTYSRRDRPNGPRTGAEVGDDFGPSGCTGESAQLYLGSCDRAIGQYLLVLGCLTVGCPLLSASFLLSTGGTPFAVVAALSIIPHFRNLATPAGALLDLVLGNCDFPG